MPPATSARSFILGPVKIVGEKFRVNRRFSTRSILSFSKFLVLIFALAFFSAFSVIIFGNVLQNTTFSGEYSFPLFISDENPGNHDGYELNNFALNENVLVKTDRDRNATNLKTILYWNDAYGVREYDIGQGREPFYNHLCPETKCFATANRSFLPNVEDFDAVLIHQRGIDWKDMPQKRRPEQRYVQWVFESQQYLFMDIKSLNNYFNWTMTFKRNSDFYLPYGFIRQVRQHPTGKALEEFIQEFGRKNRHLAKEKSSDFKAAWFVSTAPRNRVEKDT